VGLNLFSIQDVYDIKPMPGSIPVPNPGSFNKEKKENISIQMGHPK